MKVYRLDPVGTLDDLTLGDEEERRPGPKEVAISIRATSLNYRDLKVAIGNLAGEAQINPQMITQLISHKRRKAVMKQHPGGRVSRRSDTCKGTARKTGIVALVSLVAAATVALASNTALAQAYPVGPIRLVVPTTPGGGNDVIGRIIARTLSDGLGVQVVVDNRGGASGRIGAELVARAAPDGYTLLMGASSPLSTIPAVDPKLNYDPVKDFTPISLVALTEYTLVVHPSLPVKSIDDFIALARSKPGQVNFSSVGTGSSSHFTWELLKQLAKLDMLHVPYRGPGFAITAVLSGEVSSYLGAGPTLVPHVKAGRLVPLASTGPKRSKTFPDVPALNEVVPRCESTTWYGVLAPAGTPNTVITRLHDLIVKGMNVSATSQQIVASGANPASSSSPQQFSALIKTELAKWTKVVKASGITVE